jgi:hypothetical protein
MTLKSDNPFVRKIKVCPHDQLINLNLITSFLLWISKVTFFIMERISWTDHVRNEVLLAVKEERNILHEISKRRANWIGHILRKTAFYDRLLKER